MNSTPVCKEEAQLSSERLRGGSPRTNLRTAIAALPALLPAVVLLLLPLAQAQTYSVLYNFTRGSDGAFPEAGLTADKGGNLYGTAYQGGSSDRATVFKLAKKGRNWVFSPLYSFTGRTEDGGLPYGSVLIDANGNLYCTLQGGANGYGMVWEITP